MKVQVWGYSLTMNKVSRSLNIKVKIWWTFCQTTYWTLLAKSHYQNEKIKMVKRSLFTVVKIINNKVENQFVK